MEITQKELDTLMYITIMLYEDPYFRGKDMDRNKSQDWVRKQLAECFDIYSTPCGASWAVLSSKEEYEKNIKTIKF